MGELYSFDVRMRQRFEFPTDMLRYDQCWPATEGASCRLATACKSAKDFVEVWIANDMHSITLVGLRRPTEKRWLSFGWEVVPGSVKMSKC